MSTLGTFAKYNKTASFMARPTKKELAEKKAAKQLAKQPATVNTRPMPSVNDNRQATLDSLTKQATKTPAAIVPTVPLLSAKEQKMKEAGQRFTEGTKNNKANNYREAKKNLPELKKARAESLGKLNGQKAFESAVDEQGIGKSLKNAGQATTAIGGNPERYLIGKGKGSDNGFIKGLSENAEKFGKAGYKEGASGVRGALNKVAGRTLTGKAVRLGAAGAGIAAIGGALRKKREDQY